jgi:hypothetical protein
MRLLTHEDTFQCPHGGTITVQPSGGPSIKLGGREVVLVDELRNGTVVCPLANGPCARVTVVINPIAPLTRINGKEPVLQGATIATEKGTVIVVEGGGPPAWKRASVPIVEQHRSSAQRTPSGQTTSVATPPVAGESSKPPVKRRLVFRLTWDSGTPIDEADVTILPTKPQPAKAKPKFIQLRSDGKGIVRVSIGGKGAPEWLREGERIRVVIRTGPYLILREALIDPVAEPTADIRLA